MSTSPPTTLQRLLAILGDSAGSWHRDRPQASIPRAQLFFKSSLTALSHAMEDQLLSMEGEHPLVIATFQQERFYRQEARRYERIAGQTEQLYVMAAPDTDFTNRSDIYETVAFEASDPLAQEWNLVVIGEQYASCLVCEERLNLPSKAGDSLHIDPSRRFEGIWTFDRDVSCVAAELLLEQVALYRPELKDKIAAARQQLRRPIRSDAQGADPGPFAQRLVTHLQAGQYKLLKAYKSIATKERQERLANLMTRTIRQSLDVDEVLQVAVKELGQTQDACRCLIYACGDRDRKVTLAHEYLSEGVSSLAGKTWQLENNRLFANTVAEEQSVYIDSVANDLRVQGNPYLKAWASEAGIESWLLVPLTHKGQLLGMLELHYCGQCGGQSAAAKRPASGAWAKEDLALVEAIAPQIGVALIQARAYADLEKLNQQLSDLEETRYNLTAIVGHELRTPLATVKVCLESLASEPDMPLEMRQIMVDTAVTDAERLRRLVEDFLTLSRLESGRVTLMPDAFPIDECVSLALSNTTVRKAAQGDLPTIDNEVSESLPLVQIDSEWLVEVIAKLLDNACKFTDPSGRVTIQAKPIKQMLQVTISDTGRGIAPELLERIFERFYQEEGALRRTTGGTGLGLAICRQIIVSLGGEIWAESKGSEQGTSIHFTLPLAKQPRSATPSKTKQAAA